MRSSVTADDACDADGQLSELPISIERDSFFRNLIRELSGTLEEVIGLEEARGFVSVVGAKIGDEFNRIYREELGRDRLSRPQVAAACCDLKRRIGGDFYVAEQDAEKIVFANRACPFGDQVVGRPSLCMMTSNVFGRIAAENLGYANVVVERAIAEGDSGCRVVVHLTPAETAGAHGGREYFRTQD